MVRISHREQILNEGLRVVHERGFAGASVRDIVGAAGVPQGSFTNHFVTKEAFGLAVLDRYFDQTRETIRATMRNDDMAPIDRIRAYVDSTGHSLSEHGMRNGCLIGNFSIEASEHSELIRGRLVEIFNELRQAFTYALKAAVKDNDLPKSTDCKALAGFIISSLQGVTLRAKAERNTVAFDEFRTYIFGSLLANPKTRK
jgi:TetR/AcrR family transcriptional repressor of nem operon